MELGAYWEHFLSHQVKEENVAAVVCSADLNSAKRKTGEKNSHHRFLRQRVGASKEEVTLTSSTGRVVTSRGSFFKSAWERIGVVFCSKSYNFMSNRHSPETHCPDPGGILVETNWD